MNKIIENESPLTANSLEPIEFTECLRNSAPKVAARLLESNSLICPDKTEQAGYWINRIKSHCAASVAALIAAGLDLREAKEKLPHGEFNGMFKTGELPFDQRTAQMLMRMAANPAIRNPNNYALLPPALNSVYPLSSLPPAVLDDGIGKGQITPQMSIKEAKAYVKNHAEPKSSPNPVSAKSTGRRIAPEKHAAHVADDFFERLTDLLAKKLDTIPKGERTVFKENTILVVREFFDNHVPD